MPKYECTVIFDASSSVTVEADTPEEAAELAQEMVEGNQTLCHQCSNDLNTGDSLGVHVYNEECTEGLLDTTYRGELQQRKPLTDEQIHIRYKAMRGDKSPRYIEIYRDCENAHGIKGK